MADEPKSSEEKKKDDSTEQLELFAEKTEKVASKLDAVTQQIATLAETVSQQPAHQPVPLPQKPVRLSEEQVWALVEKNEISAAQAHAFLGRQNVEIAKEEARKEVEGVIATARAQGATANVTARISEYQKAIPGLMTKGSPEWNRVADRFRALVSKGHPGSVLTELTALEFVFGEDPSEHTEVRERTKERNARHTETPSSAGTRNRSTPRASKADDPDLPDGVRSYVQRLININQLSGWDDPRAAKYTERYKAMAARRAS